MDTREQSFPVLAKALGYGGVIPFVVLSVCIAAGVDLERLGIADASAKLLGYAAVIISFIGAVHWGIAMQRTDDKQSVLFIYSVVPALVAWVWLFFDVKAALFGMGLTIVAMLFVDRSLLTGLVPQAYLRMRLHLTVIVATCLFLAAIRA